MPSSSSARITRTAISPRFATRTLENTARMLSAALRSRAMGEELYLVTGANGCIGAWTVAELTGEGVPVVALDASDDLHRLALLLDADAIAGLTRVRGDITDLDAFGRTLDDRDITHVIHLAALQVPFCRADPPRGAIVNVVGTVNVFEAVKRRGAVKGPVVYTSSIGMYAADDADPATGRLAANATAHPHSHYGV